MPDEWINYIPSLVGDGIRFFSCFISYSSSDKLFAADFRDWEKPSSNFDEQVDRVIKVLRADEGAREKPPPSRL